MAKQEILPDNTVEVKLLKKHGMIKAGKTIKCHKNLVPFLHAEGKVSDADLKKHAVEEDEEVEVEVKTPAKK